MAKVKRLDHIGIAVKDLDEAIERFTRILGAEFIAKKEIILSGSKMCVGYLKLGDIIIGLDQPTNPNEFLAQFIERRGEGLHHVGLEVDDLEGLQI
jgi:catechol 2,3-dioxygenase-like lactoylglutathione lyase family enzyme